MKNEAFVASIIAENSIFSHLTLKVALNHENDIKKTDFPVKLRGKEVIHLFIP